MEKRMPSRRKSRAAKRRTFDVINPATGKALASYPIATAPQVRAKVEAARDAFRSWSRLDPKERAAYLLRFAEVLRQHGRGEARERVAAVWVQLRDSVSRSGPPRWRLPDRRWRPNDCNCPDPLSGLRRQPDRIRPDRGLRRPRGFEGSEESRPRARRIGSVHCGGRRRPRCSGA